MLHKSITVSTAEGAISVTLDIVPDEYEPYAILGAHNAFGEQLAEVRVEPGFKLTRASAAAWVDAAFRRPD